MDCKNMTEVPLMWMPNTDNGKAMKKFSKIIEDKYKISIGDYWDLHKWSIANTCEFWSEIWDFIGIICSKRFSKVVDPNVPISKMPEWFIDAKLNFAENLLKYRDERTALILAGEDKKTEKVTYAEMYEEARLYAAALRKIGLKKNDVVACQMSNTKEAIFAMAAVTSIGAIWAGSFPDLGARAVLNRFKQVKPKAFLTVDCYVLNGVKHETLEKVKEIVEGLRSLEIVIILPNGTNSLSKDISGIKNSCFLGEFLELGRNEDNSVPPMVFEQLPFSHPVFINFTSGTTGLPKAIVHGCSGLVAAGKEYILDFDSDETSIWFSPMPVGWFTWNRFSYILAFGQTLMLFEGNPYFLTPTFFWDMIDEFQISHLLFLLCTLEEFQKRGIIPTEKHSLKCLKVVATGGSVVRPRMYDFVYKMLSKGNIHFSNGYGCTELMAGAASPVTSLPVYRGELPTSALGVLLETVDDTGKPLYGQIGNLVLSNPVPNLMLGIWGDKDGSLVREMYFSKFPGKFALHDYAVINPYTKGIVISCRSDERVKHRGWSIGSSEIYNVVDLFPEIRDSVCVSHYSEEREERAVLFVKMNEGHTFCEELVNALKVAIERELSVNFVPGFILEVPEIPYTMNGKKPEVIVKRIINKMPYTVDTIRNTASLNYFKNIRELQELE